MGVFTKFKAGVATLFGMTKQQSNQSESRGKGTNRSVAESFDDLPTKFIKIVSEQKRHAEVIGKDSIQSFIDSDIPVSVYNSLRDEDLELIYENKAIVWQLLDTATQSHVGAQILFKKLTTKNVGLNTLVMRRNFISRYFLHFIQLETPKSLEYYCSGEWKRRG